jgi:outer membrane protein assembly factor BamB
MENSKQVESKNKTMVIATVAVLAVVIIALLIYRSISSTSATRDEHSASWLMLGYDAARTNYNISDDLSPSLKKKKVLKIGSGLSKENAATVFAADKDHLYVLYYPRNAEKQAQGSKVCAYDLKSGKKAWEFAESLLGVGAVDENKLYCVSGDPQRVFALNLSNGKKAWETTLVDKVSAKRVYAAVVRKDFVYVIADDAKLYAIDAATGKKKWTYSETRLVGSPAVAGGLVYGLTEDTRIVALDAATGSKQWMVGAPDWKTLLNPAVGDGKIFLVDRNRKDATDTLVALDAKTGKFSWNYKIAKNVIVNGLCVGEENVYVALGEFTKAKENSKSEGEIVAISPEKGKKVWNKEIWGMPGYLVGAGDTIYVSSTKIWRDVAGDLKAEGGKTLALSMKNGKLIEDYEIVTDDQDNEMTFMQPPILISNGSLYAQNVVDNTVHQFGK